MTSGNQEGGPVKVFDVAAYIIKRIGVVPAMKLHKLVYYSQAWSLVWDELPLFRERIEAWANGPAVPMLYAKHQGVFLVSRKHVGGNRKKLNKDQRETVDAVLDFYGEKTAQWLSDLTHYEDPWKDARSSARLAPGERGNVRISDAAMAEYYSSISE